MAQTARTWRTALSEHLRPGVFKSVTWKSIWIGLAAFIALLLVTRDVNW
jgi:hypothetical protein